MVVVVVVNEGGEEHPPPAELLGGVAVVHVVAPQAHADLQSCTVSRGLFVSSQTYLALTCLLLSIAQGWVNKSLFTSSQTPFC